MKKFALICATLLLSALAFQVPFTRWVGSPSVASAETPGQDGDLTISAANTVVNRYATLSANALAGATSITVANAGGANGLDPATLQPGNLLLVIQMQGAEIDASDTVSYGLVTDLKSAGRYEFITVGSVAGNVISIACGGLRFGYTTSGKTQVIRVPQYANLTVNAGGSIVAPAWNGTFGGVVAVNVQNNTTINGRIDVSGLGFRGGQTSANGIGFDNTSFRTGNVDLGGEKGEGVAGNGTVYDGLNGRFGRGAPGNGGGGGTSHNSGGGGGANGNNGNIYNGNGVMDGTVVGAAAWAQDPAFAANGNALTNSSGGGRGGYTYSDPATDQNALTVPPGAAAWEGDRRRAVGGLGGRGLANDPAGRIFAGGGGGAAHQNNGDGGAGGNGGGIVFLLANGIAGTGQIRANGTNGGDSIDEHRDGAGGGGAGGSVVVVANAYAGVSIESRGGNGGTHGRPIGRFGNEGHGPGGGGGGGYVAVSGGVPVTDVTGGASGVSLANTLTEFPVNGATRGASGVSNAAIVSIPFSCATDLAILKTSPVSVVLPGTSITYSIVASNNGPNPVVGARVIDTLPATLSGATWTCVATAGSSCPSPASGTGNINTTVNLLVGGSATFTLTANVSAAAPAGALSNTATIGSPTGAVDPVPGNNTSTYTVQLTRGVTETINARMISDDTCVGAGKFLTVQNIVSNAGPGTQGDNPGPEFTTQIPAQLDLVPNSCTASSGQCDIFPGRVEWNGTLNNGQSVTITFQVKVKASVTQGTRFCLTARSNYDSNGDGTNDTQAASQACVTADCVPGAPCVGAGCGTVGPGAAFPYNKGISDQAPGSILFYPYYTSNPAQAPLSNTRISITNTSTTSAANVHLFFVDGNSCSISDRYICLTQNQTTSFLASDLDPGTTGYLVAVATDLLGCPVSHNFLIGDEYVKTTISGQPFFGSLGAEAISALFDFTLPGCDGNSTTAVIPYVGAGPGYELLPAVLSATNILSRADGNRTLLVVNRVGGSLVSGAATLGTLFGILYDDQEQPASFNFAGGCQFRSILSDDFPKTTPRFELKIPAGQSGWMKFYNPSAAIGLIGCLINSNTTPGGFNGAHMLHKTTLTTASHTVPVFPPSC